MPVIKNNNDYSDKETMKGIKNDPLTEKIIGACYDVHRTLGPGFTEKIYHNALKISLDKRKLNYLSEKTYPVKFNERNVGSFRVDFTVENKVILEIKAVTGFLSKVFETIVLSYLKAANIKIGLLVNFGNKGCEIRRLVYE